MRSLIPVAVVGALFAVLASASLAAQPTTRPTDEARGEELYRRHCVSCHGTRNGGQGPAAAALVSPVPALHGKVDTREPMVRAVLRGVNAMPGFEASFDRADAVRVLKYMATLGPDKALPDRPTKNEPARKPPQKVAPGKPEPDDEGPEREEED
ncbi:MAG: cytochrome c [Myxococcota bacterium]